MSEGIETATPMLLQTPAILPSTQGEACDQLKVYDLKYDMELRTSLESQLYELVEVMKVQRMKYRMAWGKLRDFVVDKHGVDERLTAPRLIRFCRRQGGLTGGWAVPIGLGKGKRKKSEAMPKVSPAQSAIALEPQPRVQPVVSASEAITQPAVQTGLDATGSSLREMVEVKLGGDAVPGPLEQRAVQHVILSPGQPEGYISPTEREKMAKEKKAREAAEKAARDKEFDFSIKPGDVTLEQFLKS